MGQPLKNEAHQSTREWLLSTTAVHFHRAQNGDANALKALVERIQSRLIHLCLALTGNPIDAKDLTQEIYLKLLENIHSLKDPNRVVPWLYRITRNHYIDYLRSSAKRRLHYVENIDEEGKAEQSNVINMMDANIVLQQLKPDDRFLAILVYMEGCSYLEAAEILDVSESALRARLHYMKKKFAK